MYTSEESQMQTNNQILVNNKKLNMLSKLRYEVQRHRNVKNRRRTSVSDFFHFRLIVFLAKLHILESFAPFVFHVGCLEAFWKLFTCNIFTCAIITQPWLLWCLVQIKPCCFIVKMNQNLKCEKGKIQRTQLQKIIIIAFKHACKQTLVFPPLYLTGIRSQCKLNGVNFKYCLPSQTQSHPEIAM